MLPSPTDNLNISVNPIRDITNKSNNNNQSNRPITSIVNLSNHTLTADQTSLLNKGLNFCPTPGEPDISSLRCDLNSFHRSLRIKHFFQNQNENLLGQTQNSTLQTTPPPILLNRDDDVFNDPKFRNKSTWKPPQGPPTLEGMIIANELQIQTMIPRCPKNNNLTYGEKTALAELQSLQEIIIKPADKGSAIVLMNKDDYLREGYRQLSDEKFYKKVQNDLTATHMTQINVLLNQMFANGEISEKCRDYLGNFKTRTPRFYMLPKIHKGTMPPPGRPIISGNGGPTERISQFVDHFLKEVATKGKSYIKDTTHFLNIIQNHPKVPDNTLMVTLDVKSLYTNIPNSMGLKACSQSLNTHRQGTQNPSNVSIIRLLRMVLTMNNFEFNGEHFLQVGGTAMGTKTAPNYAITSMNWFEDTYVYTYHKQPLLWVRYIDDIFMIFPHGEDELTSFIQYLNSCNPHIQFTHEYSKNAINFLDTTVHMSENNTMYTDLYTKPTDAHMYLRYDSCHPKHCTKSLPYSQFLRIRRICSKESNFEEHAKTMTIHFLNRGYPPDLLQTAYHKAKNKDRTSLLESQNGTKSSQPDKERIFAISTYHPTTRSFKDTINQNWDFLSRHKTTRNIHESDLTFGYRRPKNIREYLVRAKIPTKRTKPSKPTPKCNKINCQYCTKLNKSGNIIDPFSRRSYNTIRNATCLSQNLIYCIKCTKCNILYVGQTKRQLNKRMYEHFRDIRKGDQNKALGRHFSLPNHNNVNDTEIFILEFSNRAPSDQNKKFRETIEKKWQFRLHSNFPMGLNTEDESPGLGQ